MFLSASDLIPIEEKMDELIAGLTEWKPKMGGKRVIRPPKIRVEGRDHEETVANVNRLFLRNMWSDGLPITPPTDRLVKWLLTGTDLSPDKVVARILPRGGIVTADSRCRGYRRSPVCTSPHECNHLLCLPCGSCKRPGS
ncbi:hypothetical protein ACFLT4_06075 [Chloroflexota bacterium]